MRIVFLYEHPSWSEALLQVFSDRHFVLDTVDVSELAFSADLSGHLPFDVAINRVNIMPSGISEHLMRNTSNMNHGVEMTEMYG